jgi:formylglycine-generating enzyme required for sulfatase activity
VKQGSTSVETQLTLKEGLSLPLNAGDGLVLRTGACAITLGCWQREPWSVAAGRDRFGLWAEAEVKGVTLRFRWIPPGRFWMGSPESEAGRYEDEGPRHMVTWTRGRWLCETPVTQALWEAVMGTNPSRFVSPERPVEQVSWDDCSKFLRRLRKEAPELDARLPTEAEWEHACRAGTATATWLGDLQILGERNAPLLDAIAWYGGNCGVDFELENGADITGWKQKQYEHATGGTHPVQQREPNPLGLFDMLGNVYEWCLDAGQLFGGYEGGSVVNPPPSKTGSRRVIRGGGWSSYAGYVRVALRDAYAPDDRYDDLGFRLARGQAPGRGAEPEPRSGAPGLGRATERPGHRGAGRGGAA